MSQCDSEGNYSHERTGCSENSHKEEDSCSMGIMEAFEEFNKKAEKRVQNLLVVTDVKLYTAHTETLSDENELQTLPSYVLLSDQYRQHLPPVFKHWQESFKYLEVRGVVAFDEAPKEHIQIRQPLPLSCDIELPPLANRSENLVLLGNALKLRVDTSDPPQEEIIIADGEMVEVVEEDRQPETEAVDSYERVDSDRMIRCLSPHSSQVEEALDYVTIECFTTIVVPLLNSIFNAILIEKQYQLRSIREYEIECSHRTIEAERAASEAKRIRDEMEERERIAREAAAFKAEEEKKIQEEARRQALLKQQLEENDEEEIKIRTLSYSHKREWYQPNKKCFSHRGRKMTYLQPVLKDQKQDETAENSCQATIENKVGSVTSPPSTDRKRSSRPLIRSTSYVISHSKPRRHQSEQMGKLEIQRPKKLSQSSASQSQVVTLPSIYHETSMGRLEEAENMIFSDEDKSLHVAVIAPSRVYRIPPYRISKHKSINNKS